jgi:outer membrane protein assembly factor BamE (lipoprotein component of BamABCDE complex)
MKSMTCGRATRQLSAGRPPCLLGVLTLAAVMAATLAVHAAERPSRVAYRVVNDETLSFDRVRHGMNKFDVYVALGLPTARLSVDAWVYDGCRLADDPEGKSSFDTMVIEFANDRLVRMKMVEGKALRAALANQTKAPPGETVAARK